MTKFLSFKNNYDQELKKFKIKEMKISNHTVFNYSGSPIILHRVIKNSISNNAEIEFKKIHIVPPSNFLFK